MTTSEWHRHHAWKSLQRLLPRLRAELSIEAPEQWEHFEARLNQHWERFFSLQLQLYGHHYDFFHHLEQILRLAARSWLDRPDRLKALDRQREADPYWYQSEQMVGGVLYVDLFADNLAKLCEHVPYFKKLGLTYLHLMPIFAVPVTFLILWYSHLPAPTVGSSIAQVNQEAEKGG